MSYYDTDQWIPCLGFGAKLPPFYQTVSHCFAVNGNIFDPECHHVDGVLKAYRDNVLKFKFHGPSAMAPIIKFVTNLANYEDNTEENQHYLIFIIFTNGAL